MVVLRDALKTAERSPEVLINHQSEKYAKKSCVLDEIGQLRGVGFDGLKNLVCVVLLTHRFKMYHLPHRQHNMKQPRRRCLELVTTGGKEYQG
jgi:hypothetical protein